MWASLSDLSTCLHALIGCTFLCHLPFLAGILTLSTLHLGLTLMRVTASYPYVGLVATANSDKPFLTLSDQYSSPKWDLNLGLQASTMFEHCWQLKPPRPVRVYLCLLFNYFHNFLHLFLDPARNVYFSVSTIWKSYYNQTYQKSKQNTFWPSCKMT